MATTATPKIVGKAIYLELIADPTLPADEARSLLGWKHNGVNQVIIFPQYQDDTGEIHDPVVMSRVVCSYSPKAQWDISKIREKAKTEGIDETHYITYHTYSSAEWGLLTEREKYESRKKSLDIALRRTLIDTTYEGEGEERKVVAKQGWVVRENKPIVVEVTDEDYNDLHNYRKTPQAVIRRINKVRSTLDKFPEKLA